MGGLGCQDGQAPIRIGVAGAVGSDNLHGAEMAIDEANARGGVLGRSLEMVVDDDGGEAANAARVAERFVQDPSVLAVVGHTSSVSMLSIAPFYDGRLAAVSTMATSPELSGISPWVFRMAPSDAVLGADLAQFAVRNGWRRVAVLHENAPYGRALASMFSAALERAGGTTVASDPVSGIASEGDLDVFLSTYALRRPDAIMLVTSPELGQHFLRAASDAGLRIPVIACDSWIAERLTSDPAVEGVLIPSPFLTEETDSVAMAFRARFRERYGREPGPYGATAFDAVNVVIAAIEKSGTRRGRVRAALEEIHLSPVRGVTGPISFEGGDRQQRVGGLVRIEAGVVKTHLRWSDHVVPP